jgi:hypothetical protein
MKLDKYLKLILCDKLWWSRNVAYPLECYSKRFGPFQVALCKTKHCVPQNTVDNQKSDITIYVFSFIRAKKPTHARATLAGSKSKYRRPLDSMIHLTCP